MYEKCRTIQWWTWHYIFHIARCVAEKRAQHCHCIYASLSLYIYIMYVICIFVRFWLSWTVWNSSPHLHTLPFMEHLHTSSRHRCVAHNSSANFTILINMWSNDRMYCFVNAHIYTHTCEIGTIEKCTAMLSIAESVGSFCNFMSSYM